MPVAEIRFVTRPIDKWPRKPTAKRKSSPYKASYDRTLRTLLYELQKLGADGEVALQLDITDNRIRQDGMMYADARPATPRVAIAFRCKHGPLTYYCDVFHDWQGNVRAIALGLERLRMVEQTGIVSRGEQYTGFKQLGSGIELGPGTMSVEEAAWQVAYLDSGAGIVGAIVDAPAVTNVAKAIVQTRDGGKAIFETVYRGAAKKCHPDTGGTREKWDRLQAAAAVLEKHFAEGRG